MPAPMSRSTEQSTVRPVTVDPDFEATFAGGRAVRREELETPPEIIRFQSRGLSRDYYQALGTAAAMRLRLLGTLHARGELGGPAMGEAARARLAAQQRQAWQQLQWLMAEMRRLDAEA
jgi:hypothetical protein